MTGTPLNQYRLQAKVWLYQGKAAWHFVSVPKKQSAAIARFFGGMTRGWGSLPVLVTIGRTSWTTSIFPDRKAGTYLLPLKAQVRESEKISAGDTIRLRIEIKA
jgi:hypothetical protein